METGLWIAIGLGLLFAATNGLHDASNAIATLVSTRAATPLQAISLATVFNLVGPFVVGAAVADTIGGIVTVDPAAATAVIGSGLLAAVAWNMITWAGGLPSSSGHALVGGLVGAALVAGGLDAVDWGGFDGLEPVGVVGTLVALAISPALGALAALVVVRLLVRGGRRATRRWRSPVRGGQWATAAALAFSHGANDAQKSVGVIAALLVADGEIGGVSDSPEWVTLACAVALTVGTALGGWRIIKTVGRRIYRIEPIDGLASQAASSGVILGASIVGAPTSTTQVVASSVAGVGAGRRRIHHVHWLIVRRMGAAWLLTLPAAGALAAIAYLVWSALT